MGKNTVDWQERIIILRTWEQTHSIDQTAYLCRRHESTVRKLLKREGIDYTKIPQNKFILYADKKQAKTYPYVDPRTGKKYTDITEVVMQEIEDGIY